MGVAGYAGIEAGIDASDKAGVYASIAMHRMAQERFSIVDRYYSMSDFNSFLQKIKVIDSDEFENQEWVVLLHHEWKIIIKDFSRNPGNHPLGPAIYHVEPLKRFQDDPPRNRDWEFFKVFSCSRDAFLFIDEHLRKNLKGYLLEHHVGSFLRFNIFKRDNYRCQICGRNAIADNSIILEIDHKIPKSKGGDNSPENLWVLCSDCNRGKSDKSLE